MNYRTLMDNINVLFWSLKDESTVGMANRTLAAFFGRKEEFYQLNSITSNLFTPQEIELIFADSDELFKTKKKTYTEKWIRDCNGQDKLLAITRTPQIMKNEEIASVYCTAIDITEKYRLKKALDITIDNLYASEQFSSLNFQETSNGILLSDRRGQMILFNETLCTMLQYPMEELIKINLFDLTHPEDLPKLKYMRDMLFIHEIKRFNMEQRLRLSNGDYIWVNVRSRLANNGHTDYIISCIEDIGGMKNAEETIREQQARIKNSLVELEFSKLKNKFFANLSHEFRTPLNLIFATLHLMESTLAKNKDYPGYNKMNSYLNTVRQNSYRLLRLVHNLIDLTKMDINDYHLNLKRCDIVSLIKEIIEPVKPYMKENNRKFSYKSKLKKKELICDPMNIERIILNLLSNAIKFTRKGDQITLSLGELDDEIIISVKDTGIGIKEDKLDLIFEEFRQVDESYSRGSEGSGLGLPITKYLVELHGGTITVNSIYGEGAEFIVKLPVKKGELYFIEDLSENKIENFTNKVDIEFSDIYTG
ncbi:MAG TPA: ATP-binding protein [Halanaerobiales bacterium]|nr:ATP-binding protein [Halanaerobiales bacterium]HPZ62864.1 ATP-binding protein [Halanaerobiales bacterium]HQD04235.1 ATP-binding protein [Halanaerobiales bacterium]